MMDYADRVIANDQYDILCKFVGQIDKMMHKAGLLAKDSHLDIDMRFTDKEALYALFLKPANGDFRDCHYMSMEISAVKMRAVLGALQNIMNIPERYRPA